MTSKSIFIADAHEIVRCGVRTILEAHNGFRIIGEADNVADAVASITHYHPDIAVLDYSFPEVDGLEVAHKIKSHHPSTEILILTADDRNEAILEALDVGANGYVLKSDTRCSLIEAVKALAEHRPYLTSSVSKIVARIKSAENRISPREREVIQLIADGLTSSEMAKVLGRSTKTIETHRSSILRKFDTHSTGSLVRSAIRNHFVEA